MGMGVRVPTPLGPDHDGAIALLGVDGLPPAALSRWRMDRCRIAAMSFVHPEFSGMRSAPGICYQMQEVGTFIDAAGRARRRLKAAAAGHALRWGMAGAALKAPA